MTAPVCEISGLIKRDGARQVLGPLDLSIAGSYQDVAFDLAGSVGSLVALGPDALWLWPPLFAGSA